MSKHCELSAMEQAHHNARKENLWFFCKRERVAKGRRYKLKKKSFVGQPPYGFSSQENVFQQLTIWTSMHFWTFRMSRFVPRMFHAKVYNVPHIYRSSPQQTCRLESSSPKNTSLGARHIAPRKADASHREPIGSIGNRADQKRGRKKAQLDQPKDPMLRLQVSRSPPNSKTTML